MGKGISFTGLLIIVFIVLKLIGVGSQLLVGVTLMAVIGIVIWLLIKISK